MMHLLNCHGEWLAALAALPLLPWLKARIAVAWNRLRG